MPKPADRPHPDPTASNAVGANAHLVQHGDPHVLPADLRRQ